MDPDFMATHKGDSNNYFYKEMYEFWGSKHGGFKWGIDLFSEQLIGFHMLKYPAFIHRIHALLYPETCSSNTTVGKTLNKNRL